MTGMVEKRQLDMLEWLKWTELPVSLSELVDADFIALRDSEMIEVTWQKDERSYVAYITEKGIAALQEGKEGE